MSRSAIERYLGEVEPIRRAVNELLGHADPILGALHERRIGPAEAAHRLSRLARQFAGYRIEVAAVAPHDGRLRALNAPYAHTYVLEETYLNALVAGIARERLSDLPRTASVQRAAIIRWRDELTVLAHAARAQLPADLRQAGRGEIAPSPEGG